MSTGSVRAFTLVEMMLSFLILAIMVVLLSSVLSTASRAWTTGEQQVATFQDGRAILDLITRELAMAAISPNLQFVTNPSIASARPNSDSIFWQGPLTYRVSGSAAALSNLCEMGYYIDTTYNLRRFFVPPSNATNYKIFNAEPLPSSATWVTNYVGNSGTTSIIATGVVGLWVRCYDSNGELISWAGSSGTGGGATATNHYNSAAYFRPAIPGQSGSFKYNGSNTLSGNVLPTSVEITLVTVDPRTMARNPTIPALSAVSQPSGVPAARDALNAQLITNGVRTARTFVGRITLQNGVR